MTGAYNEPELAETGDDRELTLGFAGGKKDRCLQP